MEKINFVNNQPPYINADNLNQLQSNIEDAIEIKVITANLTVEAGNTSGYVYISLPEGYTRENTAVIFKNYDRGTGDKIESPYLGVTVAYDSINSNYLYIALTNLTISEINRTYITRIGVIKVNYNGGNNE